MAEYLDLEVFNLSLEIFSQQITRDVPYFELFGSHLQSITMLLKASLDEVDSRIEVRFHCICRTTT
jgi:hypothetical protein